jgi:hypothetical protein
MTFSPKQSELDSPTTAKKTPSTISDKLKEASQPHSILQVPSLASAASRSEAEGGLTEAEQAFKWREEQRKNRIIHSPTILYQAMPGRPLRHPGDTVFVNYRMGDVAYAGDTWQYFQESPMAMRHIAPGLTTYEQQLIQQNYEFAGPRTFTPYNTPRVQSGRGGLRLAAVTQIGAGKPERPAVRRPSFPVSNRGKGGRGAAAAGCRIPVPSTEASESSPEKPDKAEESAALQKASEAVAERVAVAISKKTKRKLPLSSSSSATTEQTEEEDVEKEAVTGV